MKSKPRSCSSHAAWPLFRLGTLAATSFSLFLASCGAPPPERDSDPIPELTDPAAPAPETQPVEPAPIPEVAPQPKPEVAPEPVAPVPEPAPETEPVEPAPQPVPEAPDPEVEPTDPLPVPEPEVKVEPEPDPIANEPVTEEPATPMITTRGAPAFQTRSINAEPSVPATTLAPEEESQDFHTVDVYYGTDRLPQEGEGNNKNYGSGRNREGPMEYGKATVSIPKHHKIGIVERPKWYKLEFSEDPKKHVTIYELDKMDGDTFFGAVDETAQGRPKNEALLFIHGFNVPFDDAVRRTGQIAFDLDFGGVALAYSWPSQGSLKSYTVDEANAEWSVPHLTQFLMDLQEKTDIDKIHVIAHSMGTRVLSYALANAKDEGFDLDLNNVILAAPDIDTDIFTDQILPKIVDASDKLTMYASSDDTALKVSQTIHGHERLGLSGARILVTPGMDTINASGIDTSMIGHGYYGSHKVVVHDIFNLVIKGLEPPKRELILGALGEWDFNPDKPAP